MLYCNALFLSASDPQTLDARRRSIALQHHDQQHSAIIAPVAKEETIELQASPKISLIDETMSLNKPQKDQDFVKQ